MRCQKCGAYIRDDSVFCNYCGQKIFLHVPKREDDLKEEAVRPRDENFDAAPTTPKAEAERKLPQKQRPWVIALIILAGAIFAVLAVLVYQIQKKNQRIIINPQATPENTQSASRTEREDFTWEEPSDPLPTESPEEPTAEDTESPEETDSPAEEFSSESDTDSENTENPEDGDTEDTQAAETDDTETEPDAPIPEGVEIEYGGMIYLISDGAATLQKCYSDDEVIELPDTIEGVPLTAIGEAAFANCDHLIAIDIPEGVVSFGPYAFTYCRNLRAVVIPGSMTELGEHCFDNAGIPVFIVTDGSTGYYTAVNNDLPYVLGDSIQAANDYEW